MRFYQYTFSLFLERWRIFQFHYYNYTVGASTYVSFPQILLEIFDLNIAKTFLVIIPAVFSSSIKPIHALTLIIVYQKVVHVIGKKILKYEPVHLVRPVISSVNNSNRELHFLDHHNRNIYCMHVPRLHIHQLFLVHILLVDWCKPKQESKPLKVTNYRDKGGSWCHCITVTNSCIALTWHT